MPHIISGSPGSHTHLLFGMIDTAHVLAGQSRAVEGLLGVLAVTLEDLSLQISADGMRLKPPENKNTTTETHGHRQSKDQGQGIYRMLNQDVYV